MQDVSSSEVARLAGGLPRSTPTLLAGYTPLPRPGWLAAIRRTMPFLSRVEQGQRPWATGVKASRAGGEPQIPLAGPKQWADAGEIARAGCGEEP